MQKLRFEELTLEQKIGQLLVVRGFLDEEDREYIYQMMEKRCVGGIQIAPSLYDHKKEIELVKKHTDYPILICADMEIGFPASENKIPSAMALSITGDEELAYQFGLVTAIEAKQNGYSVIWGTIADLLDGDDMTMVSRSYGADPEHVSRMTSAVLRGYRDAGMLGGLKHFPNPGDIWRDDHVFEDYSEYTEERIREAILVPYQYAMEKGLLNSVMTAHAYFPKVDDTYPATLSEKLIGILRGAGYDGLMFTDSFAMLGILQSFGEEFGYGMAIKAGHDMVLPNYRVPFKTSYENLMNAYQKGIFTEEQLNNAVRRVLAAQNFALEEHPGVENTEVTVYQKECLERIKKDAIVLIKDEQVSTKLNPDSKKLFVLVKENCYRDETDVNLEITFKGGINDRNVGQIREQILEKFPGSKVVTASQFPCPAEIEKVCTTAVAMEEVIFLTYAGADAYMLGGEFTPRLVHMMEAVEKKLAAIIHLGNPYPLEVAPHFPRVLISIGSTGVMDYCLSALTGEFAPKGKLPFELKLKK